MALHPLIENQTMKIDNHHSGLSIGWERSLHIHKRMNKSSKSSLEFRLYFADKDRGIEFFNQQGKEYEYIEREIYEAFNNSFVRHKFIDTFYKTITPIVNCNKRSASDMRRVAKRAAKRIAMAFGLNDEITNEFIERANLYFNQFNDKYVAVNFNKNEILIGDDKQAIIDASK